MLIIGEKIFLANYGAGIVEGIGIFEEFSKEEEYIKINLIFDQMRIFLPVNKIKDDKYRRMTKKEDMIKNIQLVYEEPEKIEKNWSSRYRKNREKLQGLNVTAICKTLRDLYHLKENAMLPQGEERILERAEGLVASEVALVFKMTIKETIGKLRSGEILKEVNKL